MTYFHNKATRYVVIPVLALTLSISSVMADEPKITSQEDSIEYTKADIQSKYQTCLKKYGKRIGDIDSNKKIDINKETVGKTSIILLGMYTECKETVEDKTLWSEEYKKRRRREMIYSTMGFVISVVASLLLI